MSIRKLVIISGDYPPVQSGEAGHALHLARAMAARGLEVHVLTSRIDNVPRDPAFAVHPIMARWAWGGAWQLASFLRTIAPDGVLLLYLDGMYESHAMMTFLPSLVRRVLPHARVATQFEHTGRRTTPPSLFERLVRKAMAILLGESTVHYAFGTLLRDSHRVITLNEPHRRELTEYFPAVAQTMSLIPPPPLLRVVPERGGQSRARGRALLHADPSEFLVVYYGYMYPGKGLETLLAAMPPVITAHPNVRLVLAGEVLGHALASGDVQGSGEYLSALQSLVERLGLRDRVTWTGALAPDGDEGSQILWAADLCVLPFDRGVQLNNSTFAAAASHGLATLTTRGEDTETQFSHNENVWLCEPRDADAMSTALRTLVGDDALRSCVSAGARRLAAEYFSWSSAVERTLAAMESGADPSSTTAPET